MHLASNHPKWNMPYTPAVKVRGGVLVFVSGVTAAPVYHSHPHVPAEFAAIPDDPEGQAEAAADNLFSVLEAAGASPAGLVQLIRFIVDVERHQDALNRVLARRLGDHRPVTTTVEVVRLATDPRLHYELQAIAVAPE